VERKPKTLTARQRRFVEEYLVDLNATAAYKRAGYKGTGKTAENNASRMLGNAGVQAAIVSGRLEQAQKAQLTAELIITQLARIGFSDPVKLCHPDGSLKQPQEWDDDIAAAVMSFRKDKDGNVCEVRLFSKLEALGKLLARFAPIERKGSELGGGPIQHKHVKDMTDEELAAIVAGSAGPGTS
jgi:phage terminase small subunit